jgi:hypothetical protein
MWAEERRQEENEAAERLVRPSSKRSRKMKRKERKTHLAAGCARAQGSGGVGVAVRSGLRGMSVSTEQSVE